MTKTPQGQLLLLISWPNCCRGRVVRIAPKTLFSLSGLRLTVRISLRERGYPAPHTGNHLPISEVGVIAPTIAFHSISGADSAVSCLMSMMGQRTTTRHSTHTRIAQAQQGQRVFSTLTKSWGLMLSLILRPCLRCSPEPPCLTSTKERCHHRSLTNK